MKTPKKQIMDRIGIIFLGWKRYLQRLFQPYDITLKQLFLLRQLQKRAFLYPADIARMLFCDRPTASVIIRNMIRKEWIAQEADPDDGKRKRIRMKEPGRKKLSEIPQRLYKIAEIPLNPLAGLSSAELSELNRMLGIIEWNMSGLRDEKEKTK